MNAVNVRATAQFVYELLFRDLGLKLLAFLLAVVLFVLTRDQVTRVFEVPLRVTEDPSRVLLTELPETVKVEVRGPWTRVNRLQALDLGGASLDLQRAQPGPLQIDEATIVMPPGVVLSEIVYDPVDLRFDPVIEESVPVNVPISGVPHPDYRLARVESEPTHLTIVGGRSWVERVPSLSTEVFDVSGAAGTVVERVLEVRPPGPGVRVQGDVPSVQAIAVLEIREEERVYTVPVAVPPELDPEGVLPRTMAVRAVGPRPQLRRLTELGLSLPVHAEVDVGEGSRVLVLRFSWNDGVPPEVKQALTLDPLERRVPLPEPNADPPSK